MNYVQGINNSKLQRIHIQAFKSSLKESSCWEFYFILFFSFEPTHPLQQHFPSFQRDVETSPEELNLGCSQCRECCARPSSMGTRWARLWGPHQQFAQDNGEAILGCLPLRMTRAICSAWNLWDGGFKAPKRWGVCATCSHSSCRAALCRWNPWDSLAHAKAIICVSTGTARKALIWRWLEPAVFSVNNLSIDWRSHLLIIYKWRTRHSSAGCWQPLPELSPAMCSSRVSPSFLMLQSREGGASIHGRGLEWEEL